MGGTVIESEAEADEVNSIRRVALAIREGRQRPFTAGATAVLPACVEPDDPEMLRAKAAGRPCPLVQLDRQNYRPAALVMMGLDADPLSSAYFAAVYGDEGPDERRAVLERVLGARRSRLVVEALNDVRAKAQKAAQPQGRH